MRDRDKYVLMGEKRAVKVVGKIGDIPQDQEFCKGEGKISKRNAGGAYRKAEPQALVFQPQQRSPVQALHDYQNYLPPGHLGWPVEKSKVTVMELKPRLFFWLPATGQHINFLDLKSPIIMISNFPSAQ